MNNNGFWYNATTGFLAFLVLWSLGIPSGWAIGLAIAIGAAIPLAERMEGESAFKRYMARYSHIAVAIALGIGMYAVFGRVINASLNDIINAATDGAREQLIFRNLFAAITAAGLAYGVVYQSSVRGFVVGAAMVTFVGIALWTRSDFIRATAMAVPAGEALVAKTDTLGNNLKLAAHDERALGQVLYGVCLRPVVAVDQDGQPIQRDGAPVTIDANVAVLRVEQTSQTINGVPSVQVKIKDDQGLYSSDSVWAELAAFKWSYGALPAPPTEKVATDTASAAIEVAGDDVEFGPSQIIMTGLKVQPGDRVAVVTSAPVKYRSSVRGQEWVIIKDEMVIEVATAGEFILRSLDDSGEVSCQKIS